MNCIIIDENPEARAFLRELISQIQDINLLKECSGAIEGYNYIQNNPVDFFFMDIETPGINGLELARNLGSSCPVVIYTSSKPEYAAQAFELSVADYLVKPISANRFIQAVGRARQILLRKNEEKKIPADEFIFIRDTNIVRRLKMNDILYAEAMGDYVKLHTHERLYAIHTKLRLVEDRLPSDKFQRIHRSYIVALGKIDTLQDGSLLINGEFLPIASSYRKQLTTRMNIL